MLRRTHGRQQGVVLLISLVVLVVMALASVALMRSVFTSNIIAGNLAFQQAATNSSDQAMEVAVSWLEAVNGQSSSAQAATCAVGSTVLACNQTTYGYIATRQDPTSTQSWVDLWAALKTAGNTPVSVNAGAADSAGNTMSYFIQRMCNATGDASIANGCSVVPTASECGNSKSLDSNGGLGNLNCSTQVYYRITVQVSGPRNTVSYTQAMVAM